MRGESMKGKSKKSTYSTTFGVDPCFNLAINKLKSGYGKPQKKADSQLTANQPFLFFKVAGWTRLELVLQLIYC